MTNGPHPLFVHDLVEANGLTIKQNNLAKSHAIPLKTFVEINCEDDESHGCRGFVVEHQRDCDGTPLYGLSFTPSTVDDLIEVDDATKGLDMSVCGVVRAEIIGGWSDNSLIVLPTPNNREKERS